MIGIRSSYSLSRLSTLVLNLSDALGIFLSYASYNINSGISSGLISLVLKLSIFIATSSLFLMPSLKFSCVRHPSFLLARQIYFLFYLPGFILYFISYFLSSDILATRVYMFVSTPLIFVLPLVISSYKSVLNRALLAIVFTAPFVGNLLVNLSSGLYAF